MSTYPPSSPPGVHDDALFGVLKAEVLDIGDPAAVATWTRSLNISEEELRKAVEVAGPEVGAVYDQIHRNRQAGA